MLGLAACGSGPKTGAGEPAAAAPAPSTGLAAPAPAPAAIWIASTVTAASALVGPASGDTTEAAALLASGGAATRSGSTLTLKPTAAAAIPFTDDSTEGDEYKSYRYLGHARGAPFHVLRIGAYEGGAYLLVHDASGRRRVVDGPPLIAPDSARLAIANMDLEAGFEANTVEVFRLAGDSLVSEWRIEPADWGPDSVRWIGPGQLGLVKLWRDSAASGRYLPERATVTRQGAGWLIDPIERPRSR